MSDNQPTRRLPDDDDPGFGTGDRPDYYADVSDTPEDTPDTRAEPAAAAAGPEVRRVRADDLRHDDPAAPTDAPRHRRPGALVGAGLLAAAALVGAFALGRATADDGPDGGGGRNGPASGAPFDDGGDWGPGGGHGPGGGGHMPWPGDHGGRPDGGFDHRAPREDRATPPDQDDENDDSDDDGGQ